MVVIGTGYGLLGGERGEVAPDPRPGRAGQWQLHHQQQKQPDSGDFDWDGGMNNDYLVNCLTRL